MGNRNDPTPGPWRRVSRPDSSKSPRAPAGLVKRCAVYTRTSSDEQLEQELNSLDA